MRGGGVNEIEAEEAEEAEEAGERNVCAAQCLVCVFSVCASCVYSVCMCVIRVWTMESEGWERAAVSVSSLGESARGQATRSYVLDSRGV